MKIFNYANIYKQYHNRKININNICSDARGMMNTVYVDLPFRYSPGVRPVILLNTR